MALILNANGHSPEIGPDCWLAPNATVVGQVQMEAQCSVWFNAVVRGDVHYIKIGKQTNIQDGAVIHCTYQEAPTVIGQRVSIGHNAVIHGCTLHNEVLVGMGAIVMDHAVVETGAVIAAGAVVLANTVVPAGTIYAGAPAKMVKKVGPELAKAIRRTPDKYLMYKEWFE